MKAITRAAVLGAGTMGSRIAAHLANAGIPALLLDLPGPAEDRNRLARKGIEGALRQKPPAFFLPEYRQRIAVGNFDDDLPRLAECDWIIEAVAEDLEIKRGLLGRVEQARKPGSIVSTNTSGIPVASIAEGLGEDFRRHFLGVHFFNPPRYMHLVEVIPGPGTLPEIVAWACEVCDRVLGKGVVQAKDTPNFIANRIGTFSTAVVFQLMQQEELTVEEVDALTGPVIGNPKSATFRTLDLVGIDVAANVIRNLHENLPRDPRRDWFVVPPFMEQMLARNWLGEKTGQGFYRQEEKDGEKQIWALDWKTLTYRPRRKAGFPSVEMSRSIEDIRQRLPLLLAGEDRAGAFLWRLLSETFLYSATMVGEIADRVVEIDRAMRWGFARELGPFEMWDVLGVEKVVSRLNKEKRPAPANVERMLANGARSFYQYPADDPPRTLYFDLIGGCYQELEPRPGVLVLKDLKRARREIRCNAGASLVDLGDGVLCVEFHSKKNTLGEDQISMLMAGLQETSANFDAMVIANQGENFSAGANLVLVLMAAQGGEWDELDLAVRRFQHANMSLKYAPKPVIGAPFALTLGGGCEIALHCARNQAAAELYMGLVETAVGLIPAGGGSKEFLLRLTDNVPAGADLLPAVQQAFETIAYAKVSTSAEDARQMGFLNPGDPIAIHRERLIAQAKQLALQAAANYRPGAPRSDIRVAGEAGRAALRMGIYLARQGGHISDHDALVAGKLANVLSGGRLSGQPVVSEQYLLDLEREAFLSLCGERKTQERMQHMLKTGKPLRN
jgi:3-hydroxyacyl-CoA dehydrogenase